MRIRILRLAVAMLVLIAASAVAVFGQSTNEPDLKIGPEDISFNPSSPVHVNTNVNISSDIHSLGICWVVLGDSGLSTGDYVGYDINQPTSFNDITITTRWRGTASFTASVRVSIVYDGTVDLIGDFNLTITTGWRTDNASKHFVVERPARDYVARIAFLLGGGSGDIHLDWINITMGATDHFFEAEDYNPSTDTPAHSRGVNNIYPNNAAVRFYDGDPDSGGSQIGTDQIVGDTNYVHDLSAWVYYIRNGGVATASVNWAAAPPGYHDIYVEVDPDTAIPEANEANNKAFKTIGVYVILTITSTGGGTTSPSPGPHNYYGGTATVTADPHLFYAFDHWELDAIYYGTSSTANVDMDADHTLFATFRAVTVGGVNIAVDKVALLAPYIGVALTAVFTTAATAVYFRHVKRKREKR